MSERLQYLLARLHLLRRLLVRSDAGGLDSRHLGLIAQHDVIGRACPARPAPAAAETARQQTGA